VTTIGDISRSVALFMIFLGLSIVVHETLHLVTARFLGYEADVFYGIQFPNIYGVVHVNSPSLSATHMIIISSIGGIGTGIMFLILWCTIHDTVVMFLMSFFTVQQFTYGILEPLYSLGYVNLDLLSVIPTVGGLVALLIYGVYMSRRPSAHTHRGD
jgi:hypothetical protein